MQRKKHKTEPLHCSREEKTKCKAGTPSSQTTSMHKTCDARGFRLNTGGIRGTKTKKNNTGDASHEVNANAALAATRKEGNRAIYNARLVWSYAFKKPFTRCANVLKTLYIL